jgi:subtilisin family serine protease
MRIALGLAVPAVALVIGGCTPLHPPTGSVALSPQPRIPPRNWHLLDPSIDHVAGISAERAYRELLRDRKPQRNVVVAVIDMGIDTIHPSLYPVLWTNAGEIPGNHIDDDHNGYVDDVHGWNFVGGKDGRNLDYSSLEVTRLYTLCTDTSNSSAREKPPNCPAIVEDYTSSRKEVDRQVAELTASLDTLKAASLLLSRAIGTDSLTRAKVAALVSSDPAVRAAQKTWIRYHDIGWTEAVLPRVTADRVSQARIWFDPKFDATEIVRDHPTDWWEHDYGNNDINGPRPFHGTHVAGIIAGLPDSGVSGIAHGVRIMSVRGGCRCDERDKDIANSIRYAVDNGANIISMSFGKGYSPEKLAVDSAVK